MKVGGNGGNIVTPVHEILSVPAAALTPLPSVMVICDAIKLALFERAKGAVKVQFGGTAEYIKLIIGGNIVCILPPAGIADDVVKVMFTAQSVY